MASSESNCPTEVLVFCLFFWSVWLEDPLFLVLGGIPSFLFEGAFLFASAPDVTGFVGHRICRLPSLQDFHYSGGCRQQCWTSSFGASRRTFSVRDVDPNTTFSTDWRLCASAQSHSLRVAFRRLPSSLKHDHRSHSDTSRTTNSTPQCNNTSSVSFLHLLPSNR